MAARAVSPSQPSSPTVTPRAAPAVSGKARAYLRALAHSLEPLVRIGTAGVSEAVLTSIDEVLTEHELVKVRFGQGFDGDRKQAATAIARELGADLSQTIGRIALLYRPRGKDLPNKPQLKLT